MTVAAGPGAAGGVCQVAAAAPVAVGTMPTEGVPVTATPLTFATVGPGYEPLRSPLAAPEGGPPPADGGVCQLAAVGEVAVMTWPVVGVPVTGIPLTFATVGPG